MSPARLATPPTGGPGLAPPPADPPPTRRGRASRAATAAVALCLTAILVLTLRPGPSDRVGEWSRCIACGDLAGRDILLNILLFLPLGAALRWRGVARWRALVAGAVLATFIETMQATVVPGRDPTLGDILSNTTGTAVGIALFDLAPLLLWPTRRWSERLAAIGALAWALVAVGGAVLTRPSTRPSPYFGQWQRTWPYTDRFTGKVLSFTINGSAIPDDRISDLMALRGVLLDDTVRVRATATLGGVPGRVAPIVSVANRDLGTVMLIGQRDDDVLLRLRVRASDYRLRSPELTIRNVVPRDAAARHDTLRISADLVGDEVRWCAATSRTRGCQRALLGPASAWLFVSPFELAAGRELPLLSALWLGVALVPAAYWSARARRRAFVALAALCGVLLVALLLTIDAAGAGDWGAIGGTVAGLAIGWMLARSSSRPPAPGGHSD